jgi:hypothetical protein
MSDSSGERAEQVVKTGRQIAQTGAQIQNVWSRKYRDAAWLQNTINFPDDLPIVFQVLNRLDTRDKRKTIIALRTRLTIQIDGVDRGTGNGDQFIRIIAAKGTKRILCSNEPQQFTSPAANIEIISAGWQGRRRRDRAQDSLMNRRRA